MAKKEEMKKAKRRSGVLMPVSSLPSPYGIGGFGKSARDFVDFLKKAGQSYWQILPLGPTSYGDSPYQSFSTFAGNPYFVDIDTLIGRGFLTEKDAKKYACRSDHYVDYSELYKKRMALLKLAYKNSGISASSSKSPDPKYVKAFAAFCKENAWWLDDYALFMALKDSHGGVSFDKWPEGEKNRDEATLDKLRDKYADEIDYVRFIQFEFIVEWTELKAYANREGIEIIGDIPIYVSADSSDMWANPALFQLDDNNQPTGVAGCPPDAFSATGQLWGNPLYDWDYHKKTGYDWWMKRIAHCFKLYDVVRIDHFRGFDEYYAIPYGDETAEFGKWKKGPGYDLFRAMKEKFGDSLRVIAEDLGYLTPSVIKLVQRTGFPGMKVLQFAFDSREDSDYLPHNYTQNCVVYTGTHDNETTRGWFETCPSKDRTFAKQYLDIHSRKDIAWKFIRCALGSVADTCIIPIQDYLNLDDSARINTPSTLGGNWEWRLVEGDLTDELAERMLTMTRMYARF
ncbi:4-alpha-glucanotransferase [Butyrivibrio sp. MC2013]|uniref:4-alpha-glucanotransferase n=1 Tax=Butyrivibrio sp. MC2013 TaxID=1280686 RepID=UPI000416F34B|nr:4-alpha-glucanotransferase [Butyrivibrio sp. MC2013]